MKYSVMVAGEPGKENKYVIDVNPIFDSATAVHKNEEQSDESEKNTLDLELTEKIQIAVDSSRLEYEHSFRRAERLDNKVYILLTVCGIIFVLLIGAINKISEIDIWAIQNRIVAAYDILLLLSIIGTVILLMILICSLSGKDFKRYDTSRILENNLIQKVNRKTMARYTIMKYEIARDHNNRIISKQYKLVNLAVKLLIIIVIMLMALAILGNIVPKYIEKQVAKDVEMVEEINLKEGEYESKEYTDR